MEIPMKKLLLLSILLVAITGCGRASQADHYEPDTPNQDRESHVYDDEPTQQDEPTDVTDKTQPDEIPAQAPSNQPIPHNLATQLFEEINQIFDEDGGQLWGFYLHAPIIFVDPGTRIAVANQPDREGNLEKQGDVYIGLFPESIQVFDAVVTYDYFGGVLWVVVPWPSIEHSDQESAMRKLAHKTAHWHQHAFLTDFSVGGNSHMNEMDARVSIRLEVNALIRAFRATDQEERLSAIVDALSFRDWRRQIFDGALSENRLETIEGLAFYTELALNIGGRGTLAATLSTYAEGMVSGVNLESSFGYLSGALYAFLLSELDITWKDGLSDNSDLGQILKEAMGITALRDIGDIDLDLYRHRLIEQQEREWTSARSDTLNRLLEGMENHPTIQFHWDDYEHHGMALSGNRFSFAELGVVFQGNVEFMGSFGRLYVQGGELIMHSDGFIMAVAEDMEMEGNLVTARNWSLELNDGYSVVPYGDDFRVMTG